jgi:hypothetical protein
MPDGSRFGGRPHAKRAAGREAGYHIGGRYMGRENAAAYGARDGVPGELLVRVRPTRVVARAGIAD